MKCLLPSSLALCLAFACVSPLRADDDLRRLQQALREQGFFYGKADGSPSEETTQAVRRFQIRNSLPVTGTLDAATKRAIESNVEGPRSSTKPVPANPDNPEPRLPSEVVVDPTPARKPKPPAANPPRPSATPAPPRAATPPPSSRYENDPAPTAAPTPRAPIARPPVAEPAPGQEIGRPGESPGGPTSPIFIGGPYESAPPFVQSSVLGRVQVALAQRGFYQGDTTGRAGPRTQQAVRNFQASTGLRMSGRLDAATLRALGIAGPVYERGGPPADRGARPSRRSAAPYLGGGVYEGRIVDEREAPGPRPRRSAPAAPEVVEEDEVLEGTIEPPPR